MNKQLRQVKEFHETFNHPVKDTPGMPKAAVKKLRERLIQEELDELKDANEDDDIVEAADALTDLLYVVYGAALCYGLTDKLEKCFDEVHRSNMSKADENGDPVVREDGKILKSDSYSAPDLRKIITNN